MKLRIEYRAEYVYETAVSFSSHRVRLFPRSDHFLKVVRVDFRTNEGADVQYRRDVFDNHVANCVYRDKSSRLLCELELELELLERNAFHFLLAPEATRTPFEYRERERQVLEPYRQLRYERAPLPFWSAPTEPRPTVELLVELNEVLREHIEYERREEGAARSPVETLALGRGACRDFTVLLAETLRGMGLAARMASGYLCEFGAGEKTAEGALHAWVEVFLPGAGWIGLDPTNGVFCNHNHVTAAVGLTPPDVSPVEGNYYHKTQVGSKMEAKLELIEC